MRILYVGMKYDYGKPEQGYSFEHWNFFDFLYKAGFEIIYFDFMTLLQKYGKARMNSMLIETAENYKPDLLFSILFSDEIEQDTIRTITSSGIITLNWFCDDHWRFDNFSRYYAPHFSYVTTTASDSLPKYQEINYYNVIKTQWACNHFLYKPENKAQKIYDVSFIGQPHGSRRDVIQSLQLSGINIKTFGSGWSHSSRVSQDDMIKIFSQSKINLNLSNASSNKKTFKGRLKKNSRQFLPFSLWRHFLDVREEGQQIKGRNFEVPGCGGFMLTGEADNLTDYYREGEEIVVFRSMKDLREKIKFYLHNDSERIRVAENGYKRTVNEHTYAHRFADILNRIGFSQYSNPIIMLTEKVPAPLVEIL